MATANRTLTRRTEPAAAGRGPTRVEKGASLARGPALILGTILLAAGLFFLYKTHSFPRWANLPNGTAHKDGNYFFGIFGANGWTGELTAVAGGLLLFGAAEHHLAKTMSLIVGCALGAAAVIAVISGNVLGMAAANGWTELGWAASAAILLLNSMIPRRTRTVEAVPVGTGAAAGGLAADGMAARERRRERVAADEAGMSPAGGRGAVEEPGMAGGRTGSAAGAGMGAAAGAGAGAMGARAAEDRMAEDRMAEDRTNNQVAGDRMAGNRMAGDHMANNEMATPGMAGDQMAGDRMAGDRIAGGRMAGDGMAGDRMAGDRMAGDEVAGNGMADENTRLIEDRPRRFQRSGEMNGTGAADGAESPAQAVNAEDGQSRNTRRSGGLVGLFRRD